MRVALILFFLVLNANAQADLRERFKQQQDSSRNPATASGDMLAIQRDINATWNAIKEQGTFYFIMKSDLGKPSKLSDGITLQRGQNFTIRNERVVIYKGQLTDIFPVAVVGKNVFLPLRPVYLASHDGIWKGQRFRCTRPIGFATPVPLAKLDSEGFAAFKMRYGSWSALPSKHLKSQDFQVNFDTKECFATNTGGPSSVHKCHVVSFEDYTAASGGSRSNVQKMLNDLYLRNRNLESCNVGG